MKKTVFIVSIFSAFVLGGAGVWGWQQFHSGGASSVPQGAQTSLTGGDSLDEFLMSGRDPFNAMQRLHEQMNQFFRNDDFFSHDRNSGKFGSWFSTPATGFGAKIEQGQDASSVFYKIELGNNDLSDVHVNVKDGYVSIDAKKTKQSANTYRQSSVSQRFPVPSGVDPDSAKIDKQDNAIIIRFEKIS